MMKQEQYLGMVLRRMRQATPGLAPIKPEAYSPSKAMSLAAEVSGRPQYRENPKGRAKHKMHICPARIYATHPDPRVRAMANAQADSLHELNAIIANPWGNPRTKWQLAYDRRCKKPNVSACPQHDLYCIREKGPDDDWKSIPRKA